MGNTEYHIPMSSNIKKQKYIYVGSIFMEHLLLKLTFSFGHCPNNLSSENLKMFLVPNEETSS